MLTDPHPEEKVPPGEDADIAEITRVSLAILDTKGRPVRRGQHPSSMGASAPSSLSGPDVPNDLKIGLFAEPRTYPAWARFSNGSQDDDEKGDIHGMAIKLMGVGGPKVLDAERDEPTHDFVLMDHPVLFTCDVASNRAFGQVMEQASQISPFRHLMFWADLRTRRSAYIALWHFLVGGRRASSRRCRRQQDAHQPGPQHLLERDSLRPRPLRLSTSRPVADDRPRADRHALTRPAPRGAGGPPRQGGGPV